MNNPRKYEIKTFQQLLNIVTLDNVENISFDLFQWLRYYATFIEEWRKTYPEKSKGRKNWELFKCTFTWIDDGENVMKDITVTNEETGEVITLEFSEKDE